MEIIYDQLEYLPMPETSERNQVYAPPVSKSIERAHVLTLKVGGDTEADVIEAVESYLFSVRTGGGLRGIVSGGYASGYTAEHRHNPAMTHEAYVAALEEWRRSR